MQAASAQVYQDYIYPCGMVILSLSPLALCSPKGYLVWLGEEPTHTQYHPEALLLLLLPLLLMLQAADDEPE